MRPHWVVMDQDRGSEVVKFLQKKVTKTESSKLSLAQKVLELNGQLATDATLIRKLQEEKYVRSPHLRVPHGPHACMCITAIYTHVMYP